MQRQFSQHNCWTYTMTKCTTKQHTKNTQKQQNKVCNQTKQSPGLVTSNNNWSRHKMGLMQSPVWKNVHNAKKWHSLTYKYSLLLHQWRKHVCVRYLSDEALSFKSAQNCSQASSIRSNAKWNVDKICVQLLSEFTLKTFNFWHHNPVYVSNWLCHKVWLYTSDVQCVVYIDHHHHFVCS